MSLFGNPFMDQADTLAAAFDLQDQRDRARVIAVALEQQVAAVDALHQQHPVCKRHGLARCDCGSGWLYRCSTCAQRDRLRPCPTWRATHPEEN